MASILVIAYDFPPRRSSGVYRPTGLIKHLPKLGWVPTVLTVKPRPGEVEDPTLLSKVPPQVQIVQTSYLNFSSWEDSTAKGLRTARLLQSPDRVSRPSGLTRTLRRLANLVRACVYFPDMFAGWIPFAVAKAIQLSYRRRFDVIYSTSPPRSALAVGLIIKAFLHIPWIAEFRDPWYPAEGRLRQRIDSWFLGVLLRYADSVVVVTEGFRQELEQLYPRWSHKLALVRNGYDEEDFVADQEPPKEILPPGFFHMTHLGTIYAGHSGNFFPALIELLEENPKLRQTVRVNIVGFPDLAVRDFADHPSLRGVLQLRDFVRHSEALHFMATSDCLLIFLGNRDFSRQAVSGKFFEYLRSGRPILAIAYDGDLKRLIEAAGVGWVIEPDDREAIKRVLTRVLQDSRQRDVAPHSLRAFVEQFRYDRLAVRLVSVLNSVVGHDS